MKEPTSEKRDFVPGTPLVSVVIPLFNAAQDYEVCFTSLARQSLTDWEVIGIDSASSDGSVDRIAAAFPWVKLVRCDSNLGYRRGAQLGSQYARGKLIVIVNQDVEFDPDFLSELVRPFESDERVGMTAPLILLYDRREIVNEAGNTFHFSGLYGSRGLGAPHTDFRGTLDLGIASGCCFCIRAKLWGELGGFSNDIDAFATGWHAGNEDHDLCWRLRLIGYTIKLACSSRLFHKYTKKPWASNRLNSCYCCYWLTLLRLLRWRSLLSLAPFAAMNFLLLWVQGCRGGFGTVKLLGSTQWAIFRRWPVIMEMRRRVQAQRKVRDLEVLDAMETHLTVATNPLAQGFYDLVSRCYYIVFRQAIRLMQA